MRPKGQLFDLKGFRNFYGLTQKEIAEAVKRPSSFLSAIEHGKRSAPKAFLDELVIIYGAKNISDFLSDPVAPLNGDVRNVKNSLVNSPGGMDVPQEVAMKIKESENTERSQVKTISSSEAPETYQSFVKLLLAAEERLEKANDRIRELEAENAQLKRELDAKI